MKTFKLRLSIWNILDRIKSNSESYLRYVFKPFRFWFSDLGSVNTTVRNGMEYRETNHIGIGINLYCERFKINIVTMKKEGLSYDPPRPVEEIYKVEDQRESIQARSGGWSTANCRRTWTVRTFTSETEWYWTSLTIHLVLSTSFF